MDDNAGMAAAVAADPVDVRSGGDRRWRLAAIGMLAPLAVLALVRRGDGVGGDTADYLASAQDLTGPSRFPPGLPMLLAPFPTTWMPWVMATVAVALIVSIWWAAVLVGGWRAGVAASFFLWLSPWIWTDAGDVMADRLGALMLVGALIALLHERPAVAGVLAGLSAVTRLAHVAFLTGITRRAWLAAGVVVAALAAWQLGVKGSLLGYSSGEASWAVRHIMGTDVTLEGVVPATMSNVEYFGRVLIGEAGIIAPGVIFLGAFGLWRHWGPTARFAGVAAALNVAIYLPYYFQSVRFMLPAGCLLTVYAAAVFGALPHRHARPVVHPQSTSRKAL